MTGQEFLVFVIVALAAAYLVWKLGFASRAPKRRGIDVARDRLVRNKRRAAVSSRAGGDRGRGARP